MEPSKKASLQNSDFHVVSDVEAPGIPIEEPELPKVISSERQVIFGSKLKPRTEVFFDKTSHGHITKHSRANRKNRFAEFTPDQKHWKHLVIIPKIPRIFRPDFPNISWHVAVYFTLGSVAWVVNGQYAMWPRDGDASLQFNINAMGYSALVGGLLFWVGAYLSIVEALNEKEKLNFSIELRHVMHKVEKEPRDIQKFIKSKISNSAADASNGERKKGACHLHYVEKNTTSDTNTPWRWWGMETSSLGWWASVIQFTGATAFTISVITGTPGVLSPSQWQLNYALSWTMQVVGSIGFIVSSAMLMLEEQREWFIPALDRIGWHSAFWNVIGSIGFFLCAVFGYLSNWNGNGEVCCQFWGTAFNTYYGSWAFLISSVLLLIEVENKEPTGFDNAVSRVAAWVAVKTKCDSEELEEEEVVRRESLNETAASMGDRKVCY